MLIAEFYHIPTLYALGFIALSLAISIIASIMDPLKDDEKVVTKTEHQSH